MLFTNRIKNSMAMIAMSAAMLAATACTSEPDLTPAEQLYRDAKDGNAKLDHLIAHDAVITSQAVSDILEPFEEDTAAFDAEMESWQQKEPTPEFRAHEMETYQLATEEIQRLVDRLGEQGFSAVPTGEGGDTCEEPTGPTADTQIARHAPTDSTTALDTVFTKDTYLLRQLCYAACAVLVPTGCGIFVPFSPAWWTCVIVARAGCNKLCKGETCW